MKHDAPNNPPAGSLPPSRSATRPSPGARRSAHHMLLFGGVRKHKRALRALFAALVLAATAIALVVIYTDIKWASVTDAIARLNPVAVLPLMALLPIVGFPISVVYLFAGARFGPVWGGVVVSVATVVHLVGTYAIARSFLRAPLRRFIERRHAHLPQVPEDEHALVTVIATLVPGLPYFVRNYLLVLAGVRFRVYFWICLPIYVARSYVTILLGDMSSDPSRNKFIILVAIDVLKVAICAIVIWRLRVHHRKFHGHHEHEHLPPGDASAKPNAAGQ